MSCLAVPCRGDVRYVLCRLQVLLHAPTPDVYSGNFISPWLLRHWDHIKTATVAAVVSSPLVVILALMQVSQIPTHPLQYPPSLTHSAKCRPSYYTAVVGLLLLLLAICCC